MTYLFIYAVTAVLFSLIVVYYNARTNHPWESTNYLRVVAVSTIWPVFILFFALFMFVEWVALRKSK